MTADARFNYRGPAAIGGIDFPAVCIREERDIIAFVDADGIEEQHGGMRSWEGETSFSASAVPERFTPKPWSSAPADAVLVRLPDGREGTALLNTIRSDDHLWSLTFQGIGPPPR